MTTAYREEIEEVLRTAMADLGFEAVEESVGQALQHLKSISGRLALRLIHDNTRAKDVAGLGAAVAWMKAAGDLADSKSIEHKRGNDNGSGCDGTNPSFGGRCGFGERDEPRAGISHS